MAPGIVGREAALLEVESFLDAAGAGFAVLVLEGDAGIGKTTLWREARRRAQERGALVLPCRPSAAEAKLSFAAVADMLAPLDEAERHDRSVDRRHRARNGTVDGSSIRFGTVGGSAVHYTGSVSGDSMSGSYTTASGDGSWTAHRA